MERIHLDVPELIELTGVVDPLHPSGGRAACCFRVTLREDIDETSAACEWVWLQEVLEH